MTDWTRRRLIASVGLVVSGGLAGCSSGDADPSNFRAPNAVVIHQRNDPRISYPEDVGVRVTVENLDPNEHSGVLEVDLRSADAEPTASPEEGATPTAGGWTKSREITVTGGTTRSYFFVFEDVASGPDDEFTATARIVGSD